MANRDRLESNDYFLNQQTDDSLPLSNIHGFGPSPQARLEGREALNQVEKSLLIGHRCFDCLYPNRSISVEEN